MDNIYEISLLLDFYGQLLTEKQYTMLDLYYNNDYSLAEIAENLSISRQGVYDNIKRSKASLGKYESKLGLVHRFVTNAARAKEALELLKDIDKKSLAECDRVRLENVEALIGMLAGEKE